jgi:hypothetical protein
MTDEQLEGRFAGMRVRYAGATLFDLVGGFSTEPSVYHWSNPTGEKDDAFHTFVRAHPVGVSCDICKRGGFA